MRDWIGLDKVDAGKIYEVRERRYSWDEQTLTYQFWGVGVVTKVDTSDGTRAHVLWFFISHDMLKPGSPHIEWTLRDDASRTMEFRPAEDPLVYIDMQITVEGQDWLSRASDRQEKAWPFRGGSKLAVDPWGPQ
jgi:hypothetical protein